MQSSFFLIPYAWLPLCGSKQGIYLSLTKKRMTSRRNEFITVSIIALVLAGAFIAMPGIDLFVSGLFFRDGKWLLDPDSPWLFLIYRGLPRLGQLMLIVITLLWVISQFKRCEKLHSKRWLLSFLLAGILIGPTLVVDVDLKDHLDRARPGNTQEFGGPRKFTPAFIPSDQCIKNCSFVSGHVVGVSFLMAFGWLGSPIQRRRWLVGSLIASSVVGLARMIPGSHFLSDVIFAWLFIYFSLWLTEWALLRLGWQPQPDQGGISI